MDENQTGHVMFHLRLFLILALCGLLAWPVQAQTAPVDSLTVKEMHPPFDDIESGGLRFLAKVATGDADAEMGGGLTGGELDSSRVAVGAWVEVVYGTGARRKLSGEWEERMVTVRGFVQAVDWGQRKLVLIREQKGGTKTLALDRVQTLTVIDAKNAVNSATLDSLAESRDGMITRIALKLIVGTVGGLMGAAIVASSLPCYSKAYYGDRPIFCDSLEAAFLYGYPAGIAIGVSTVDVKTVDPRDRSTMSLIKSLGVSLGGSAVGLIGGILLTDVNDDVFWPSFFVGPVVGATWASEWWRKPAARRLSVSLMPDPRGCLSAVATLRF